MLDLVYEFSIISLQRVSTYILLSVMVCIGCSIVTCCVFICVLSQYLKRADHDTTDANECIINGTGESKI